MARKRVEGAIRDWEGAVAALRKIGSLERGIELAEASLQETIAQAKEQAASYVKMLQVEIKLAALELKAFCEARQADLGPKKSKALNFGVLGFRWSTKIMLPRSEAALAGVLTMLKALEQRQCIQTKETILKDEVKKLGEKNLAQLAAVGLRKQAGDAFFYEINRERIVASDQ
jgi:phage host-nuclease inhibitor protein Gam